jgi:GTPase SAR1 family protein
MKLELTRGKVQRPQKTVIYGPEGVGKSTIASQFPVPVFLDTEGGTHHLDVVRFPAATTWDLISTAIGQLLTGHHEFKTLVIDTADWLEKRLTEHICHKSKKDSIEDFGYGKGYILLAEEFSKFLLSLDNLLCKGMHIVLLAHSTVRKFESPDQAGAYDRYELKLSKQVAPLLKEWADLILFANYVTRVTEKDNGKLRGVGGKERMLFATHTAAYDAKNRHGLDDKFELDFAQIANIFEVKSQEPKNDTTPPMLERINPMQRLLADKNSAQREKVTAGALKRGWIKEGETYLDIPADIATQAVAFPERFFAAFSI